MRLRHVIPGLILIGFAGPAPAADPLPRAELDKRVVRIVFDAETVGVKLYNDGKREDCLRFYQATLMTLAPFLDHRPELVKKIENELVKSGSMSTEEAAFALRKVLDETSAACGGGKAPLWERLGGELSVSQVVHEVFVLAAADPKVNFNRDGKYKPDAEGVRQLEKKLLQFVSSVTGGPLKYPGTDMKKAHAGMKITDAEFDALAGHLKTVLNKYKVKKEDADELMAIVGSTRKDIVENGKKPLWDRLGGEAGVKAVVAEFLATAAKDPKANIDRNGNYPLTKERGDRVSRQLIEFVSSVTGGPLKYTGRDMKNAHQGMKITEDEFKAAAGHLIAALKKFNVPQAEIDELVGLVAGTAKDMIEVKK